jgi:hypothetical protein
MVREIELSTELWRTRFLIELCYLDDRKIVWCVKYVLVKFERDHGSECLSETEDVLTKIANYQIFNLRV